MYMPVATGQTGNAAYSPAQAMGHVLGLRRETTNYVVKSLQLAASTLPGSSWCFTDPDVE